MKMSFVAVMWIGIGLVIGYAANWLWNRSKIRRLKDEIRGMRMALNRFMGKG